MSKVSDPIVIFENPQRGVAPHPLLGIGLLRQIDISTYPGLARLNKLTAKVSSTTVTGLPYWIVKDPATTNNIYALDSGGQVYKSTNDGASWSTVAGETAGGAGQGMAIWKGYLFVARATALDVYGPLASSPSWSNSWKTDLDATQDFHTMLPSVDDKLYIACGRYIYQISEATTFDPASSGTYTTTARAITLPQNYNAKCLADLGSNLMVGTWKGITGAVYQKVADIFPYNRTTLTLGIPIKLGENGVHAMITVGNRLYAIAGLNAMIFITDGSSASVVAELPNYAVNLLDTGLRVDVWPGAVMYHRGKIFFGVDNSAAVNGNIGVWSFNPATRQLILENIISTGNDGSTVEIAIGSLFSLSNETYLIGWKDFTPTATSGIDQKSSSSFVGSYGGVIETAFIQVGQALANRTMPQLEFYLAKPLTSGQGIRVKYRKDLSASFTTLGTIDFTNGAVQSYNLAASQITNAVFVQFRIELTSGGSDSPELVRVSLINPSQN